MMKCSIFTYIYLYDLYLSLYMKDQNQQPGKRSQQYTLGTLQVKLNWPILTGICHWYWKQTCQTYARSSIIKSENGNKKDCAARHPLITLSIYPYSTDKVSKHIFPSSFKILLHPFMSGGKATMTHLSVIWK